MPFNEYKAGTISNPHKQWAPTLKRHNIARIGVSRLIRESDGAKLYELRIDREEDGRTVSIILDRATLDQIHEIEQTITKQDNAEPAMYKHAWCKSREILIHAEPLGGEEP